MTKKALLIDIVNIFFINALIYHVQDKVHSFPSIYLNPNPFLPFSPCHPLTSVPFPRVPLRCREREVDRVIQTFLLSIHLPSLFGFVCHHSPKFTSFIRQATPLLFHPHFFFVLLFLFSTLCFFCLFFYFWILNPSVSFVLLSCFHSYTIDNVMSYSSSFALPNLRLELSYETAYS